MSVDFLDDAGVLELMSARTLVPGNVEFTCSVGDAVIDYVVCSHLLFPYLRVSADLLSPFKTHACLGVILDLEAMVEPQCIRVKPLEVPEALGPDSHWLTFMSAAQSLGDPDKSILEAPLVMPEDLYEA
eukprot:9136516-Pyramimonas_sp.AAC.1